MTIDQSICCSVVWTHCSPGSIGHPSVLLEAVDNVCVNLVSVLEALAEQDRADHIGRSAVDQKRRIYRLAWRENHILIKILNNTKKNVWGSEESSGN